MKYFATLLPDIGPRELTKGNTQLTRQNEFSSTKIKLVYCLTRKTLRCNSLVQKICMFIQKEISHCKNSLALGSQGPKHYIFGDLFDAREYMISSFYLNWTKVTRN